MPFQDVRGGSGLSGGGPPGTLVFKAELALKGLEALRFGGGGPWNLLKKPLQVLEFLEAPGGPWRPLERPGGPWRPLEAPGGPWRPLQAPGGPWRPLEAPGGPWRPLEAPGGPWRPLEAPGGPPAAGLKNLINSRNGN